jgi:O-antigen/teichoic acid export membrane protein
MVTTLYIVVGSPTLGIVMVCLSRNKAVARILSNIIIVGILYFFIYIIAFAKGKCFFNKKYWKFGLTMCVPLLPHFLSQTALNQSDRIMISKLVGDDKTAIYSVAYTIAAVISIVITSINNSLLPYMFQNLKNRNYKMKYRINELVVLVGILCFFVMFLGPEFILLVGGERYYDAIWVIPSVTTATYFTFVYSAFSYVELYYEKTIYMSVGSIVACLVNIVLNYIFIPIAGYVVAGYTTLIGFILLATLHYVFYRRCIKEERITDDIIDVRFMLLFSIGMLVLMGVVTISYNYIIVRCLFIAVLIVAAYIHRKKILSLIKKTCRPK